MKRLIKPIAKWMLSMLLGTMLLTSCELQSDEEILEDIAAEFNEKTTDQNNEKKK